MGNKAFSEKPCQLILQNNTTETLDKECPLPVRNFKTILVKSGKSDILQPQSQPSGREAAFTNSTRQEEPSDNSFHCKPDPLLCADFQRFDMNEHGDLRPNTFHC